MEMSIGKENMDKSVKTSDTFLLPRAVVESDHCLEDGVARTFVDGEGFKESSILEGIPRMNESGKIELNTTYFTPKAEVSSMATNSWKA
jgi:hypothetical protein